MTAEVQPTVNADTSQGQSAESREAEVPQQDGHEENDPRGENGSTAAAQRGVGVALQSTAQQVADVIRRDASPSNSHGDPLHNAAIEFKGAAVGIRSVQEYITNLPEEQRVAAVRTALDQLTTILDFQDKKLGGVGLWLKETLLENGVSEHGFKAEYPSIANAIWRAKTSRNKRDQAIRWLNGRWQSERAKAWTERAEHTGAFLENVRILYKTVPRWHDAVKFINTEIMRRLKEGAASVSNRPVVQPIDIRKAAEHMEEEVIEQADLELYEAQYGAQGIIEARTEIPPQMMDPEIDIVARIHEIEASTPQAPQDAMLATSRSLRSVAEQPTPSKRPAPQDEGQAAEASRKKAYTRSTHAQLARRTQSGPQGRPQVAGQAPLLEPLFPNLATRVMLDHESADQCGCDQAVSEEWRAAVSSERSPTPLAQFGMLIEWHGHAGTAVCSKHLRSLASHLGLVVDGITNEVLTERLTILYKERGNIAALKVKTGYFTWWRPAHRPKRPEDGLGMYKFNHTNTAKAEAQRVDRLKMLSLATGCTDSNKLLQELSCWGVDGATAFEGIFDWWFRDPLITSMIDDEFAMYRHHQRQPSNADVPDLLPLMNFSLLQQLACSDPRMFFLMLALRPDTNHRLVMFPQSTIYRTSDSEAKIRLDRNVKDLVEEGVGKNVLQCSIYLDELGNLGEPEFLREFHRGGLRDWYYDKWKPLGRGPVVGEFHNDMWTQEDMESSEKKGLQIAWEEPAFDLKKRGNMFVARPEIPIRCEEVLKPGELHREIRPCYIAVMDDGKSLEIPACGTWRDLAIAIQEFELPSMNIAGQEIPSGAAPWRFPPAAELRDLGPLSDALLGRRSWDSLNVSQEFDKLLRLDVAGWAEWIREWEEKALQQLQEAWELVQDCEKEKYGEKSYFHLKDLIQTDPDRAPPQLAADEAPTASQDITGEDGVSGTVIDHTLDVAQDEEGHLNEGINIMVAFLHSGGDVEEEHQTQLQTLQRDAHPSLATSPRPGREEGRVHDTPANLDTFPATDALPARDEPEAPSLSPTQQILGDQGRTSPGLGRRRVHPKRYGYS